MKSLMKTPNMKIEILIKLIKSYMGKRRKKKIKSTRRKLNDQSKLLFNFKISLYLMLYIVTSIFTENNV